MKILRMKSPLCLAALALIAASTSASATVTFQFSRVTTFATNWASSSGAAGSTLAWGIVIDTAGNGFEQTYSSAGLSITAGTAQAMKVGTGDPGGGAASDDVLFVSPILMNLITNNNDGAQIGQNRVTAITNVPYGTAGISFGDNFRIVWFDRTALGGAVNFGEHFGFFGNTLFTIPGDGATVDYSAPFVGPDALKPMTEHFDVPEPSALLLSALGALALVRRRR